MKKLMFTAVAIAMAVVANAAQIKWSCNNGVADGTDTGVTSATTFYLIDSGVLSQTAIYEAVIGGASLNDAVASGAVRTVTGANEGVINETFNNDWTGSKSLYMVCLDENLNALYFSEEISKSILGTGATKFAFSANSSLDPVSADMSGFDKSYGGWVQTAAIPEPTSGLLMLLGMAGLALRRRRA